MAPPGLLQSQSLGGPSAAVAMLRPPPCKTLWPTLETESQPPPPEPKLHALAPPPKVPLMLLLMPLCTWARAALPRWISSSSVMTDG